MNKSMGALGGVVLVLFALVVAGCGGSGKEELTKSEFVKQGNAICAKAAKAREKAIFELVKTAKGNQQEVREEAALKAVPFYEGATEQIDDLGAPAGDEAKVEAVVGAMEEAAAKIRANPQSAFAGELLFRKANKAAESYGLDACVA